MHNIRTYVHTCIHMHNICTYIVHTYAHMHKYKGAQYAGLWKVRNNFTTHVQLVVDKIYQLNTGQSG